MTTTDNRDAYPPGHPFAGLSPDGVQAPTRDEYDRIATIVRGAQIVGAVVRPDDVWRAIRDNATIEADIRRRYRVAADA